MSTSTAPPHPNRRGDDTRERLLDAVEHLIADLGFRSLTHRLIAHRADVHVALLNYHFGNKEQLIEEALARRAARLLQTQKDAIANLRARGMWSIEDVLWAFWLPFAALDSNGTEPEWRSYLCMVARLEETDPEDRMYLRHFGAVQREFLYALRKTLPGVAEATLANGFRYCRALFSREILSRCRRYTPDEQPVPTKPELLIAFLSGGLKSLAAAALPQEQVA